jgi:hypothetical protein
MSIAELRSYGVELHQQSLRGRRTTDPGVIDNQRLNYPMIVGLMTEKAKKLQLTDIDIDAMYREIAEEHIANKPEPQEQGNPEDIQDALRQVRELYGMNGHTSSPPVTRTTEEADEREQFRLEFLDAYEDFLEEFFEGDMPKTARQYLNDFLVDEYGHTPEWYKQHTEGQQFRALSVDSNPTPQQRDKADAKAAILTLLRRYPDQEFCVEQVRERLRSDKSHKTIKRYLDQLETENLVAGRSIATVITKGKVVYPRFYQAKF